jgi:hypothetical protein
MFTMETLAALADAIIADDRATIDRLLDSAPADLIDLCNDQCDPPPSLRAFLTDPERYDYHGIVIYDFAERAHKTITEMECRIAEVHEIDMTFSPYAGMSLTDLSHTDEDDACAEELPRVRANRARLLNR